MSPYTLGIVAGQIFNDAADGIVGLRETVEQLEVEIIQRALISTGGNRNQAGKKLKMNRTTLVQKIKKYGESRFMPPAPRTRRKSAVTFERSSTGEIVQRTEEVQNVGGGQASPPADQSQV